MQKRRFVCGYCGRRFTHATSGVSMQFRCPTCGKLLKRRSEAVDDKEKHRFRGDRGRASAARQVVASGIDADGKERREDAREAQWRRVFWPILVLASLAGWGLGYVARPQGPEQKAREYKTAAAEERKNVVRELSATRERIEDLQDVIDKLQEQKGGFR